jgi:transcriptional regulator with XRE-family HTH domain
MDVIEAIETKKEDVEPLTSVFSEFLRNDFIERNRKNPRFSLRSYARLINKDQSYISKIFRGKSRISAKAMTAIAAKLNLTSAILNELIEKELGNLPYLRAEDEYYNLTKDWVAHAILELAQTHQFSPDPIIIAQRFSLHIELVLSTIEKLVRHGFIAVKSDETWEVLRPNCAPMNHKNTSQARKDLQRQFLELSLKALENIDISQRAHMGLTVAIPKKRIEEARQKLVAFYMNFGETMQSHRTNEPLDEVYQLCLSFFPLSHEV